MNARQIGVAASALEASYEFYFGKRKPMIDPDTLTYDELCRLMAEHPRLMAKFVEIIRAELTDGNLTATDIEEARDQ